MRRIVVALVAVLILSLPLAAWAGWPKPGDPMVPFALETDEGKKIDSESLKGKVLVINFMNTVCATCVAELGEMKKYLAKNPGKVEFLPVAVDMRGAAAVKPFKESGFGFTFLLDPTFGYGRKYGATFTPFTVVVGKDGNITGILRGYGDAEAAELQKLLP